MGSPTRAVLFRARVRLEWDKMVTFYVLFIADKERRVHTAATRNPLEYWADLQIWQATLGRSIVFVEKHSAETADKRERAFDRMSQSRRRAFITRRNPKWVDVVTNGIPALPGSPLITRFVPVPASSVSRKLDTEIDDEPMPWDDPGSEGEGLGGVGAKRIPVVPVRPRGAAEPLPKPDDEEGDEP